MRIHAGAYAGGTFLNDVAGTSAAPIWIGGASTDPAERPVIEGGTEGLHLVRCSYVVVHDLEVRGVGANGVNSDDGGDLANPLAAHHQVFRSLFIHDVGGDGNQDGLKLSGLYDFVVDNCEITRCGGAMSGSGIDMVGCHNGLIARCHLHDLSANAVQAKGGTADVEIRWCRMINAGERAVNIGGSTGFAFFRPPLLKDGPNAEARRVRVAANVIVGSNAPAAFVGAVDCEFAQNTVIDPRTWIIRILQGDQLVAPYTFAPCSNNTFANNLVYFDRSVLRTHVNIGGNTEPTTFTFANNLWYAHDNPAGSGPSLPSAETGGYRRRRPAPDRSRRRGLLDLHHRPCGGGGSGAGAGRGGLPRRVLPRPAADRRVRRARGVARRLRRRRRGGGRRISSIISARSSRRIRRRISTPTGA